MAGTEHFDAFMKLTDELYPHCTLTEKLTVYLQHHPIRAVPFLEELIRALEAFVSKDHDDPNTD
jgi:hypothetical protein